MPLDRATVLQSRDATIESVPVPEWGGDILIRTLTAGERETLDDWYLSRDENTNKTMKGFRALLVASTACTEDGTLLFTQDDIPALEQKSYAALQRVADASMRLNKLRAEDQEGLRKNFNGEAVDASPSA